MVKPNLFRLDHLTNLFAFRWADNLTVYPFLINEEL